MLLRVRMLYYLKQEVIGEHADSVLKGADIRYLMLIECLLSGSVTVAHFDAREAKPVHLLTLSEMLISGCQRWSSRRCLHRGGTLMQTARCSLVFSNMVGLFIQCFN